MLHTGLCPADHYNNCNDGDCYSDNRRVRTAFEDVNHRHHLLHCLHYLGPD